MKSKQVLSIDQMKHLRELGLDTSDASMHWQFCLRLNLFQWSARLRGKAYSLRFSTEYEA